jgi:hypothetical protein
VQVTDLAELNLPILDEPNHPRLRQYTRQHTKDWSAVVDASEWTESLASLREK